MPLRAVLVLFCLPLAGAILAGLLGLTFPTALLPLAVATALGLWLGLRGTTQATSAPLETPQLPPANQEDKKLRHDIRGIISPAMLVADQLATNPDPDVRRAAETINNTLDRLTDRLKQKPAQTTP
ncbi:SoxR reducing system RseC family protein [Acetobacter vaccinii]|uniref:SoxR reducing system RseC family protein n=1 Tax=Acetobacter vaccinii TaxID=2592655 RepID=A0A5C1YMA3_9PROT|nr:SoxR reducing system RseC family protein [Acetobacter vaccinii]QEO16638.1 SoxR reducing system RseC family protein [Acetobacter vaccinii]